MTRLKASLQKPQDLDEVCHKQNNKQCVYGWTITSVISRIPTIGRGRTYLKRWLNSPAAVSLRFLVYSQVLGATET